MAAASLGLVMTAAATLHAMRGEFSSIGINAVLLAVTVFVTWGR
jgi:hypothetical protein